MDITITGKDVAESIAAEIAQATGTDCEAVIGEVDSLVIYHHTAAIARVTPLYSVIAVAPLSGLFAGEITEIPDEARTLSGMREVAHTLEEATAHVLSAAMHH